MKTNFLNTQLIMMGFSVISTLIVTIFYKNRKILIIGWMIIAIISILMIIVQLGIKIYIDDKYDEEIFEQFYEQADLNDEYKKGISIGISGIKIIEAKEIYIEKSVEAYTIFKIKTMLYIIIQIMFIMCMLCLINKLNSIELKKERLAKDDLIIR